MVDPSMPKWTVHDSAHLYGISDWGAGLLQINAGGNLEIIPATTTPSSGIDLSKLAEELQEEGIDLPVLVRFPDILHSHIQRLASAMTKAMEAMEYQGKFRGVFPIKVNQQRHVIQDVIEFGKCCHLGLEAGSKPELLIVLAMLDDPEALIICNGYKDTEYIETAFLAQKIGRKPIIVIESTHELERIIAVSEKTGIRPHLGIRANLATQGQGHWQSSTGDQAKFGLSASAIVDVVSWLSERGYLDCLELLHFHIGSQVPGIATFKDALREGAQFYVELCSMGAPMGYFDVGGGLGVDYDGSSTPSANSRNYTNTEYAWDVVSAIHGRCEERNIPHPHIVTESGRATVAHHAVLMFDVLGVHQHPNDRTDIVPEPDDPEPIKTLAKARKSVHQNRFKEGYHIALDARQKLLQMFNLGMATLTQRARGERLFWQILRNIGEQIDASDFPPEEFDVLVQTLADTYICNFSIFQSVPDTWAIDQLFPIMPIHRLDERPTRSAVLGDLTCDSDGKLDHFVGSQTAKRTLNVHEPNGKAYRFGAFLVGAYQETLGDLHNLFGDTHVACVRTNEHGEHRLTLLSQGDTIKKVLGYVKYRPDHLVQLVKTSSEHAIESGQITSEESARLLNAYENALESYTYLE